MYGPDVLLRGQLSPFVFLPATKHQHCHSCLHQQWSDGSREGNPQRPTFYICLLVDPGNYINIRASAGNIFMLIRNLHHAHQCQHSTVAKWFQCQQGYYESLLSEKEKDSLWPIIKKQECFLDLSSSVHAACLQRIVILFF